MKRPGWRLCLVTDRKLVAGGKLLAAVERALDAGLGAVQLREKDLTGAELFALAGRLRVLTERYGARLFINERCDVALGVGADGVHLARGAFSPRDARRLVGKGRLIGVSAHSVEEALMAQEEGADFVTLGPVYPTPSKRAYGRPIGLGPLKRARELVKIPVFAIGGIKKERVEEVLSAGAYGVALISAVLKSPDPGKSTAELLSVIRGATIRRKGAYHDEA